MFRCECLVFGEVDPAAFGAQEGHGPDEGRLEDVFEFHRMVHRFGDRVQLHQFLPLLLQHSPIFQRKIDAHEAEDADGNDAQEPEDTDLLAGGEVHRQNRPHRNDHGG